MPVDDVVEELVLVTGTDELLAEVVLLELLLLVGNAAHFAAFARHLCSVVSRHLFSAS